SSIDLGTVEPLLLLGIAVAWRWRDRILQPGLGSGAAIAVKLFLWPLVAWPVIMRRLRASLAVVGVAVAAALISWAVIGFEGIGAYPGLLHKLSSHEATSSYSVIALGVRAHLPVAAGTALSVFIAVALIAVAAWVAR